MDVTLKFLGAARTVTGSRHAIILDQAGRRRHLLVDCGLFQGLKELRLLNREPFPVPAAEVETVVLTHAHIDHSGYLPRLYQEGFRGRVICTEATRELLEIMLLDAAKLQEEEAAYANQQGYSKHHPALPLYTTADVYHLLPLVEGFPYGVPVAVNDVVDVTFREAGHILGSAIAELTVRGEQQTKRLVFSGDLGRYDNPLLFDPFPVTQADVLVVESTYGDRNNRVADPEAELARVVNEALTTGGVLVIAAFAVGRTQTLLYYLDRLREAGRVPRVPIYVDSPMGIRVTGLYPRYPDYHRLGRGDVFDFEGVHFVQSQNESKGLNARPGPAIIISASGMCTGGRILHHLYHRLRRPQDTVLLVGYQAAGTRGRQLQEGAPHLRMFGEEVPVRCRVAQLDGFSAHADRAELLRWLANFPRAPKRVFVVHGEPASAESLAAAARQELGWPTVIVPEPLESDRVFTGI